MDALQAIDLAEWSIEKNLMPLPEQACGQTAQLLATVNADKLRRNNRTHRSCTDGEARLAQKPGKAFRLYYLSSMAVDTASHVITHIQADLADEKDSRHLMDLVTKIAHTLKGQGLPLQSVLADSGFSSGENYAGHPMPPWSSKAWWATFPSVGCTNPTEGFSPTTLTKMPMSARKASSCLASD
jgi:hypothetical protein